jgi:hypothetical protein
MLNVKSKKPLKVVIALTSQGKDYFSTMTRVAVASLRVSNPKLRVAIACDRHSDEEMRRVGDPLIDEVDEWLAVETPLENAGFRNRYVKTKLRSLIEEPFLFLDSDVFVRGDLSEIFSLECDIAGARNHSRETFAEQIWDQDRATIEAMNWEVSKQVYLNGGVLFFNDTEGAYRFAAEWHQRWLQSYHKRKNYRDQPALNNALYVTQPKLVILEDRFNAQVKTNTFVANNAIIWHFYSSHLQCFFQFDLLVEHALKANKLDYESIRSYQTQSAPWKIELLGDKFIGKRISKQGRAGGWEIDWLSTRRLKTSFFSPCSAVIEFFLRCLGNRVK